MYGDDFHGRLEAGVESDGVKELMGALSGDSTEEVANRVVRIDQVTDTKDGCDEKEMTEFHLVDV